MDMDMDGYGGWFLWGYRISADSPGFIQLIQAGTTNIGHVLGQNWQVIQHIGWVKLKERGAGPSFWYNQPYVDTARCQLYSGTTLK